MKVVCFLVVGTCVCSGEALSGDYVVLERVEDNRSAAF